MNSTTHPIEREEVMAYLDGELDAARAAEVSAHLEQCAECRARATDLRSVSERMSAWQIESAPASVEKKIFAALPATETKKPAKRWLGFRPWVWQLAGGFAFVVCVVVVMLMTFGAAQFAVGPPNLLRSRMAGNEASAVGSLRTLNTACVTYRSTYGGFPQNLGQLGPGDPASKAAADLIDSALASGMKSGYQFAYTPGAIDVNRNVVDYTITARPVEVGKTGQRQFYADQSGVIRASPTGPADASSPPLDAPWRNSNDKPQAQEVTKEATGRAAGDGAVTPAGPMIIRTASLTIYTKEFDNTRAAMEQVVRAHGGWIAQLSATGQAGGPRSLSVTLRIPADKLDAALTDLKKLGRVQDESVSGEEVTQPHIDLVARLDNARHTEQRLVEVLRNRTGKVSDVLGVEREIARVREETERMEAQRKTMEKQVAFSTVTLRISEEYQAQLSVPRTSVATQLWNAAVDGYHSLTETILGVALFFLSYGPVLLFWLALLFWPARYAWRRLRAAAA